MLDEKFHELYQFYKENYAAIEHEELYKWKAIKHFQDNLPLGTADFASVLENALGEMGNLMDAGSWKKYAPKSKIIWAAKKEPQSVYEAFDLLFNEEKDLSSRRLAFRERINRIFSEDPEKHVYDCDQDDRALLVYLSARYPHKYYLYKYSMFKVFNAHVGYKDKLCKGNSVERIDQYNQMCDEIREIVLKDEQMLSLYDQRRRDYIDPEYHLLVQDIIYSVYYFNDPSLLEYGSKRAYRKPFKLKAKTPAISLKPAKVDYLNETRKHKALGEAGEYFVFKEEQARVESYGLGLENSVRWVSKEDGDGLGYDILSYDKHGREIYIEVKTTTGKESNAFYITANELEASKQLAGQYRLYRVYAFNEKKQVGKIAYREGSLEDLCISPYIYKCELH